LYCQLLCVSTRYVVLSAVVCIYTTRCIVSCRVYLHDTLYRQLSCVCQLLYYMTRCVDHG